jgi:hypothetical protein
MIMRSIMTKATITKAKATTMSLADITKPISLFTPG